VQASRVVSGMLASIALVAAAAAAGTMGPRAVGHSPGDGHGEAGWKAVEQAFGRTGTMQPGGVFRIAFPRDDLNVRVGSVTLEPSFALGSYVAFMPMGPGTNADAMMMGDLALRDEEVPGVTARLFEHGIDVTALHNHLNEMTPHVLYMHFGARGEPGALAASLLEALGPISPSRIAVRGGASVLGRTIDVKGVESVLGHRGVVNPWGVLQVSVPRAGKITLNGMDVPPAMGVATALSFQPMGGGEAAITGDFVLVASEVNRVAQTLRGHGIEVTALHNHGLVEAPRLFYMHFWARGDATGLARGLRAALDQTDSQGPERVSR
jgi:hypothetical protein